MSSFFCSRLTNEKRKKKVRETKLHYSPVLALLVPVGALPEPAVLPLLDRVQEVLTDDVGAVVGLGGRGVARVGAVLLLDDGLELFCFVIFFVFFFVRGFLFGVFWGSPPPAW